VFKASGLKSVGNDRAPFGCVPPDEVPILFC